jgi:hypothetical protein
MCLSLCFFHQVCELDIIFNFHKVGPCHAAHFHSFGDVLTPLSQAYYILDEVLIGGYLQEVNKREILRICATQDDMMEEPKDGAAAPGTVMPR